MPELRQLFSDIHRRQKKVHDLAGQIERKIELSGGDAGGTAVSALFMDLKQINNQLRLIDTWSIQVKDVDRGLMDFPHIKDGREVFLCWELGEEDIHFWHEIDTGYLGRAEL